MAIITHFCANQKRVVPALRQACLRWNQFDQIKNIAVMLTKQRQRSFNHAEMHGPVGYASMTKTVNA